MHEDDQADELGGHRSLSAGEAAALIGVSIGTVRGWADAGRLPSHRTVGGHRRFDAEELRAWLARRGAPARIPRRTRRAPQSIPACPLMARELNARTDAIVARVEDGYHPEVATPLTPPSAAAARRLTIRFVRVVTAGLEAGRPGTLTGRAQLAGFRGGVEGPIGGRLLLEHGRAAVAIVSEAEAALDEGVTVEPLALPALQAMIDHAHVALLRGFTQGRASARGAPARG